MALCRKCGRNLKGAAYICAECVELDAIATELFDNMRSFAGQLSPGSQAVAREKATARCTCGQTVSINDSSIGEMILHPIPPCQDYMKYDGPTYLARIGFTHKN